MAFTRKTGKDGKPQKTIVQFGVGTELEAKLVEIGQAIEGGDPSPDLLADITLLGADLKLEQIKAQSQRIDGIDERLSQLEQKFDEGLKTILAAVEGIKSD